MCGLVTTPPGRRRQLGHRTGPCTPREGGHAVGAVRGAGGDRLVARLHVQDVLERRAEPLVESRLGQPVCHGRPWYRTDPFVIRELLADCALSSGTRSCAA